MKKTTENYVDFQLKLRWILKSTEDQWKFTETIMENSVNFTLTFHWQVPPNFRRLFEVSSTVGYLMEDQRKISVEFPLPSRCTFLRSFSIEISVSLILRWFCVDLPLVFLAISYQCTLFPVCSPIYLSKKIDFIKQTFYTK